MDPSLFTIPLPRNARTARAPRPADARAPATTLLAEFIGGPENLLVHEAWEMVRRGDADANPLVLCGSPGVGKSQLARAMAHARLHRGSDDEAKRNGAASQVATTGQDFARSFANAVDTDGMEDFRRRHRGAALLLVDQLETLGDKEAAQQELVNTIDALLAGEGFVVVTCRHAPADQAWMLPGLASRLSGGLVVPVKPPEEAARAALLMAFAALRKFELNPGDAARFGSLTEGCASQLAEVVDQLIAEMSAAEAPLEEVLAQFAVRLSERDLPSLAKITNAVCRFFRVKVADVRGPTRRKGVVHARQIAMYLARQLTPTSLQAVGKHFGGRDHTTVLHACSKTEEMVQCDATTNQAIQELRELLKG